MLAAARIGSLPVVQRRGDNSVVAAARSPRHSMLCAAATHSGRSVSSLHGINHRQQFRQLARPTRHTPPPLHAAAVEPAATAAGVLPAASSDPAVEFLGVLNGMQTVRGVLEVDACPDLVYSILTDYDRCSEVFENISASQTLEEEGEKQIIQACSWKFLAFSGSFNVHLSVDEDEQARSLVFRLVRSSFMRDFEGRWNVAPAASADAAAAAAAATASVQHQPGSASSSSRARVEHVLAVKPLMPIPAAIAPYTAGIFTRQVENILRDLQKEISAKAATSAR